jgi:hypothetical protein
MRPKSPGDPVIPSPRSLRTPRSPTLRPLITVIGPRIPRDEFPTTEPLTDGTIAATLGAKTRSGKGIGNYNKGVYHCTQ